MTTTGKLTLSPPIYKESLSLHRSQRLEGYLVKFANPECETSPINTDFGGPYPGVKDDGLTAVTFRLVAGNLTNQRLNTFLNRSGEQIFKRQQNPVCSGLFTCYHFKDVARKREKSAVRNGNTRRSDQSTFNLRFYWIVCRRSLCSQHR